MAGEPKKAARASAGQFLIPTATATGLSLAASAAFGGYQMGSRDADLKEEIREWVRDEFVTKDASGDSDELLSANIAEIRRAVERIEKSTEPIPDMRATLNVLERQSGEKQK